MPIVGVPRGIDQPSFREHLRVEVRARKRCENREQGGIGFFLYREADRCPSGGRSVGVETDDEYAMDVDSALSDFPDCVTDFVEQSGFSSFP
jgi:hypothetical protein